MVKTLPDGSYGLVSSPDSLIYRRQDVPLVYDITTVCYVANSEYVLSHESMFEGQVGAVQVPTERSIDIDTALDFKVAEFLLKLKGTSI
jgi:N-acylneuraminate cytidylyltransferase